MSSHTRLVRWGNSLAVRLPKSVIEKAGLAEGQELTIGAGAEGHVTINKAEPDLTLEDLVARITPQNRYGETGWGGTVGREVLDEW
jgi:antitoxin MazE